MHSNPLVTIGIPTYRRAETYLPQAIQSALNQTYSNIEVLVSDNCSDDGTEMVVQSFCDDRIQYYKQTENIGYLKNWNFCLEKANGKYFLLLLDDDLIDDDFVECCVQAIKAQSNVGLVLTGTRVIDGDGEIKSETYNQGSGHSFEDFCLGWFGSKFPLYLCSTLFLTKGLREVGGLRSKTHTYLDVAAEVKMVSKFSRVDIFDVKASFRRHDKNMGSNSMKVHEWCEDCKYLLELMCELASGKRAEIQAVGMSYFCAQNYERACYISSPFQRIKTLLQVNKYFHCSSSLVYFLYRSWRNAVRRRLSKIFRTVWPRS